MNRKLYSVFIICLIALVVGEFQTSAEDEEVWMPDTTLRKAVRERLQLPETTH